MMVPKSLVVGKGSGRVPSGSSGKADVEEGKGLVTTCPNSLVILGKDEVT